MLLTARYVLPIATPHIEHGAVLVRGDKIVEIGDFEHLQRAASGRAGARLRSGRAHAGLHRSAHSPRVHARCAVWSTTCRTRSGSSSSCRRSSSSPARTGTTRRCLGALEALQSGITTVADITRDRRVGTGRSGDRAARGHLPRSLHDGQEPGRRRSCNARPRTSRRGARRRDATRITVGIAPHAPYSCHPELFSRVAEYAMDGTMVAIHLAGSVEEYEFVKYGSSMLATDVRDSYDARCSAVASDRCQSRALRSAVGAVRRPEHHGRALHAGRRRRHRGARRRGRLHRALPAL